ncbi:MAG: orotate phosphoribosyltransferase [Gemmatimonadota bacterium]|jgi:orotate phosphoribosyltransferase
MDHRTRLRELLVERSVRLGDFTLASGARSSYYVDARRTTMTAEGQFLTGKVCRRAVSESGWTFSHVGGLTMGADPVSYAIAHASWIEGEPLDAFSVRKQPKGHGTGQQVEGGLPAGARVVAIEDSMTTGGSTLQAIEALERHGAEVVGVLTVVDREEGGRQRIESAGYPLLAVFTGPELLAAARERSGDEPGPGA